MIQLIVPKNHIVVFSKLAKVLLLLVFSGMLGDAVKAEMLSFLTGQTLQRKPEKKKKNKWCNQKNISKAGNNDKH